MQCDSHARGIAFTSEPVDRAELLWRWSLPVSSEVTVANRVLALLYSGGVGKVQPPAVSAALTFNVRLADCFYSSLRG